MATIEFDVQQRPVPGSPTHSWVAIDKANGTEIPLPRGGNTGCLEGYPEIEVYLASTYAITGKVVYFRQRGDQRDNEPGKSTTYTFNLPGGHMIIVRDIPRAVFSMTMK